MDGTLEQLLNEVRCCAVCAGQLPLGPRPIVQAGREARVLVIGQAPGSKVHESGVPWRDASGDRLRDWMGVDEKMFYDANRLAIFPMGFCYPGRGVSGDMPPRPECAPLWHVRLLSSLPQRRLTLLVGAYAQACYLAGRGKTSVTETVRGFRHCMPRFFPLPHPSWRSTIWMRKNPWFHSDALPALQEAIAKAMR
jgi:uracil-DNA glycosylase